MKNILFVDNVSQGWQYMKPFFETVNQGWNIRILDNTEDAMAILNTEPIQMLVAGNGLRDPDNRSFIRVVGDIFPDIIRIELPANINNKMIISDNHITSAPVPFFSIVETMTRSFSLNDILNDNELRVLLSRIDRLPSLPSLYQAIMTELQSRDVSMKKIGDIISRDLAMTAKMLQLVNSSFFGLSHRINDPAHAVNMLGINTVKAMVLSLQIFEQFDNPKKKAEMERLWQHSFRVGTLSRTYALTSFKNKQLADEAFTAGVLHDIGKLILVAKFPVECQLINDLVTRSGYEHQEAEHVVLGASHAQIGAYLLGLWGFSSAIVEAVAFHHDPAQCAFRCDTPLVMVYAANAIANQLLNGSADSIDDLGLDRNVRLDLNLDEHLSVWLEKSREIVTSS